jgi:hypothetical protein
MRILSQSKRDHVQVRDQLKLPDIGCSGSVAQFQATRSDQQVLKRNSDTPRWALAVDPSRAKGDLDR